MKFTILYDKILSNCLLVSHKSFPFDLFVGRGDWLIAINIPDLIRLVTIYMCKRFSLLFFFITIKGCSFWVGYLGCVVVVATGNSLQGIMILKEKCRADDNNSWFDVQWMLLKFCRTSLLLEPLLHFVVEIHISVQLPSFLQLGL